MWMSFKGNVWQTICECDGPADHAEPSTEQLSVSKRPTDNNANALTKNPSQLDEEIVKVI